MNNRTSYLLAVAGAALLLFAVFGCGCSTVQSRVTNPLADKYGARAPLDAFRRAEGASVGMIDPSGASVRVYYVDDYGNVLTNGVNERTMLDRPIVQRVQSAPPIAPAGQDNAVQPGTPATTAGGTDDPRSRGDGSESLSNAMQRLDVLLAEPIK